MLEPDKKVESFGFNDVPTDEDFVKISSYLSGLAEFIKKCQTPMTIAIQGDWGTGKTSAMCTLQGKLNKDDYWQIDFNTWQYSQFDLGDQLVFSLIGTILKELELKINLDSHNEKLKNGKILSRLEETSSKITKIAKSFVFGASKTIIKNIVPNGEAVVAGTEAAVKTYQNISEDTETESNSFGPDASIKLITDLRANLEDIVHSIVHAKPDTDGFQGPKRIVIYVDDLDRLEPERAVTVMEAIKVFLDIPDCVFVLAIDFAVVLRGVRAKYGQDFAEDKARAFFDKIIQVPFHLPLGAYAVENLLKEGLKSIGVEVPEDRLSIFDCLAQNSVGRNPRSIKRLVNTFGLIKIIGSKLPSSEESIAGDEHIFAVLCMQTAYPEVFTELTRPQGNKRKEKWKEIADKANSDDSGTEKRREWFEKFGISEYLEPVFCVFIEHVGELFSNKEALNLELLNDALAQSAVTAVGTSEAVQERSKGGGSVLEGMF